MIEANEFVYNDDMNRLRALITLHAPVIFASLVLLLGCGLTLTWYRHAINPDGISYITIAEKYARGDFAGAVNGYWGPLYSWLLSPFARLGLDMQLGAKLVGACMGVLALFAAFHIMRQWKVKPLHIYVGLGILVPVLLFWIMSGPITPDMLVLAVFLGYVYMLGRAPSLKSGLLAGLLAGLGFLAKAYMLPFFAVHFLFMVLYAYKTSSNREFRNTYKNYFAGMALVFAVLAVPWIVLLSNKYHKPTYSTAASYNFALLNQDKPGHPMEYLGLLPPGSGTAASVWEDPSYMKQASWSPLGSRRDMGWAVRTFFDNLKRAGAAFLEFSALAPAGLLALGVYILHKKRKLGTKQIMAVSAMVVYTAGYILINAEYRYFWPVYICLFLLGVYYFGVSRLDLSVWARRAFVGIVLATVAVTPLTQVYYQRNRQVAPRYIADELTPYIKPGEHVASDDFASIAYCFYLRAACYGKLNESLGTTKNRAQLTANKITKVIIMQGDEDWQKPDYLDGFSEIKRVGLTVLLAKN